MIRRNEMETLNQQWLKQERERRINEYQKWLRMYPWTWFATLEVTASTDVEAKGLFQDWIMELERADGNNELLVGRT